MYLYIVALGGREEAERDLPEKDLPLVVGKSTENGILTAISVLKSGTGITRSIVNAMAKKWIKDMMFFIS